MPEPPNKKAESPKKWVPPIPQEKVEPHVETEDSEASPAGESTPEDELTPDPSAEIF